MIVSPPSVLKRLMTALWSDTKPGRLAVSMVIAPRKEWKL